MLLLRKFKRIIRAIAGGLRFAGQIALASMVATICYDVLMRYVFKAPTTWSLEVNTFLVLFITLMPAGDVLAAGSHLRITFFVEKMSPSLQRVLEKLTCLVGCLFGLVMTWKGFNMAYMAFKYNERMSTPIGTPMGIPYSFIPIGFFILCLYYSLSLLVGDDVSPEETRQQEV